MPVRKEKRKATKTSTELVRTISGVMSSFNGVPIGSLSKDVFERRTSTGSEDFSLLICLDDIKFVLLSFFTLIETI